MRQKTPHDFKFLQHCYSGKLNNLLMSLIFFFLKSFHIRVSCLPGIAPSSQCKCQRHKTECSGASSVLLILLLFFNFQDVWGVLLGGLCWLTSKTNP